MPNSRSAAKRVRQNEKHRLVNRSARSEIKTLTKKLSELVEKKEVDAAKVLFRTLVSKMDKAARKRVYHPNNVARRKSKISTLLNKLSAGQT
jgi:small subunit ribosomal protein S20